MPGLPAGLYIRVSTMNQVDRDSLSTQESRLRAYCKANNLKVHKVYRDAGVSAKDTNRPAFKAMERDIEAGKVRAVLVTKLDRITRSSRDLLQLMDFYHEHDVQFVSITQNIDSSGPFGRFMRDLLGLIAQLEREVTAERVSEDMRHRATLGKWNGGIPPYGYTTRQRAVNELIASGLSEEEAMLRASEAVPEAKKLCIDPKEAKVVKEMFSDYIRSRSLRKVTHKLNSLGHRTRRGSSWAASSIRRLLTNPTYIGKTWYGKRRTDLRTGKLKSVANGDWTIVDGEHEAIVSPEIFNEVQEILASRFMKPTRAFRTYLLSGLLRCGKCGGAMHGYTFTKKTKGKPGKTYSYYKCHNYGSKGSSVCAGLTVPSKQLDDFVVKNLMDLSKDRHFLNDRKRMLEAVREEISGKASRESREMGKLKAEEKSLQSRLDVLLDRLERGLIEDEDFRRRYEELKKSLSNNRMLQADISSVSARPEIAFDALEASFDEIASFGKNWDFLDEQGKAMKVQSVVKEISVTEDRVDMQVFLDVEDVVRGGMGSSPQPA